MTQSLNDRRRRVVHGRLPWQAYLLLSPVLALLLGGVLWPMITMVGTSFSRADNYGQAIGGFTLDAYGQLLNESFFKSLQYSLLTATVNTAICVVVGYLISSFIVSRPRNVQMVLLVLIIIPFWTDSLVRVFAWINLMSPGGVIPLALGLFGVEDASLIPSSTAVYIGLLYAFLPAAVFPIYASMQGIDPATRLAARDLGCGWFGVHRRVVLPLSLPGILGTVVLVFAPTIGTFVIPVLLGGGKDPLLGNLIVSLFTEFRNQPTGAAASVVLLLIMLLLAAIVLLFNSWRARKR